MLSQYKQDRFENALFQFLSEFWPARRYPQMLRWLMFRLIKIFVICNICFKSAFGVWTASCCLKTFWHKPLFCMYPFIKKGYNYCICLFHLEKKSSCWILKCIIIYFVCASGAGVLDDVLIPFLHLYVSCMHVRYISCPFLMGLYRWEKSVCHAFYNGLEDTGIIVPLRGIVCIVWNTWFILGIIIFIHVLCVL